MPTEYAYPEQFWWVNATQWVMLLLVVVIFFVPLVREILRRGPLNPTDFILMGVCLVVVVILPPLAEATLIGGLESELHAEVRQAYRILHAAGWSTARIIGLAAVWIHVFWLLTWWVRVERKVLKTVLVYSLPILWLCLLPAVSTPFSVVDRIACRNNAKQLALAWHDYHDKTPRFPASVLRTDGVERSWRVEMLPYLDQAPLRNRYDVTAAWDVDPNAALAREKVDPLGCRGNYRPRDSSDRYYTAFAGVVGSNTVFDPDGHIRTFKDVSDGTANTIAFVEACGAQIVWSEPRDLQLDEVRLGVNLPGPQPGTSRGVISSCHYPHRGGHVIFHDGSVKMIGEGISPQVLKDLLTADGGESIPRDDRNEIRWK